jgi:glucokinase
MSSGSRTTIAPMLLAGDVGGTKTLLGLFSTGTPRPLATHTASFRTLDFPDLAALSREFLRQVGGDAARLDAACFGVAGPVKDRKATLTNVPWEVDADAISRQLPVPLADVINDLEALAWCVPVLEASEVGVLSAGAPDPNGGAALIAAGTGLGVALLPKLNGRYLPVPSEGGHADFAPRSDAEDRLRRALTREFGRAEIEHVLSGPGLFNIHRFMYPHTCEDLARGSGPGEMPALISQAALGGHCEPCRASLDMFVSAYGACAGNLALTALSTGGIFLGGGIAPRILPALRWPSFLESFFAKAPMEHLVRRTPVTVILNPSAGLIGAATCAMDALTRSGAPARPAPGPASPAVP